MTIIDLLSIRAIVEADGKVRCVNCIDAGDYRKGCEPTDEILVSRDDLEDPDKLYICDYCEKNSDQFSLLSSDYRKDQFCKIILFPLDKTSQVCGKFQPLRFLHYPFTEFFHRSSIALTYRSSLFSR